MSTDIIGIDLATGYCCVAFWNEQSNRAEVIPNDQGNRTTPSWVAFHDSERLVGESAKNLVSVNPRNAIYAVKRIIGRNFSDPVVQEEMKLFPFEVVDSGDNRPQIAVEFKGESKKFFPEQISAILLEKMKKIAESYLGKPIKKAVITIPAYFNDSQRQATKDAAIIAGLEPVRLVAEPTAAALAYSLDKNSEMEKKVIVIDLGSGTLDVSLLAIDNGIIEVIATSGDTHLGGEDYDNRLLMHCAEEFKKKHKLDILSNPKSIRRLKIACEKAKITLSTATEVSVDVDSLMEGTDFSTKITRAKFEQLCDDLIRKPLKCIDSVLLDGKIAKADINDIVLVGGSSRIPKFQTLVSEYFHGKDLCKDINPDEAIGLGASIQAAILSGKTSEQLDQLVLIDVTPLSLGVETAGNVMSTIISRGTIIPCKKSQIFSTYQDNQTAVTVQIFEGERKFCRDNNLLGTFELRNIPPAPRGTTQIEITLDVDCNGILNVEAVEKATKNKNSITVTNEKGRLSQEQIERLVKESEKYAQEDQEKFLYITAKNELETLVYSSRSSYLQSEAKDKLSPEEKVELENELDATEKWLAESAPNASVSDINSQIKSLTEKVHKLANKVYAESTPEEHSQQFPYTADQTPDGIDPQQWQEVLRKFQEQHANMPDSDDDDGENSLPQNNTY